MADDRYTYLKVPEEFYYEFYSEGPKGIVKKIVRYSLIQESTYQIYNLGFGDWDELNQDVDDLVNTNNEDRQKVLATVADTIVDFLNNHPQAAVFAKGSTASRTRLYQMNISAYWNEISKASYLVQGYIDGYWQSLEKGINFEAFIIKKKF